MSWPHAAWRVLLLATVISSAVSCEAERRVILTCPSPDGTNKAVFWVLLTPSAAGTAYFCLNVAASTRSTSSMISDDKDREESQVMVMAGRWRRTIDVALVEAPASRISRGRDAALRLVGRALQRDGRPRPSRRLSRQRHDSGWFRQHLRAAMKIRPSWRILLAWGLIFEAITWPLHHSGRRDLELPILTSIAVLGVLAVVQRAS